MSFNVFRRVAHLEKKYINTPHFDQFIGKRRRLEQKYWAFLQINHKDLIVQINCQCKDSVWHRLTWFLF